MKLLEGEWVNYRSMSLPKHAGVIQVQESRMAFMAGAWALYTMVIKKLDPGREPTQNDLKLMAQLVAEMEEYASRIGAGNERSD